MRASTKKFIIVLLALVALNEVHTRVYYGFDSGAKTSITGSDIVFEEGTSGTSTVYLNATSAAALVDSHSTTFYPNDYNVTHGVYASGATPDDINAIDNDFFIVDATGSSTSTAAYYPSSYNLINGTTLVSGSVASLPIDDSSYMIFRSALTKTTNIEDPVDSDATDVDSSQDKGFNTNFTEQQLGPDSRYDTLSEQYFGDLTVDYVDTNTSNVDSQASVGTHSSFPAQQSGPDSIYDTLTEAVRASGGGWGITSSSFTAASTHTTYRYMGGTSPNTQDMRVNKLYVRVDGAGTIAIALYTGGTLTNPTGAVKRTEAYNVAVIAGWNEIDVPDFDWPANTVTWIGWAHNTGIYYSTSSADCGDFQSARGRWDQTSPANADETQPMPSSPGAGSFSNFWYAVYAGYEITDPQELDLEEQWVNLPVAEGSELAIRTGSFTGTEDLRLDFWNSTASAWVALGNLTPNSWNNYTIGPYLTDTNFTIRFKGTSESSDPDQDTWQIDASFIRILGIINVEDYVDTSTSDVDAVAGIGSHSSFVAQQSEPDSVYDTLAESKFVNITLINAESFEGSWPPSGWAETGAWNGENNQAHQGSYSADFDGGSNLSGDLDTPSLDCSGARAIYVSFWFRDEALDGDDILLQYWDGSNWDTIQDLDGYTEYTWVHWEQNVTDSQYFINGFRVRFSAVTVFWGEHIYVDEVTVIKEIRDSKIDLEEQWTDLVYDFPYEELCIYAGSTGTEDLHVDIWNTTTSTWDTIFTDLTPNSWNNASVSSWLTGSTFTIRYKGANESGDTVQDQWQIDACLIHTWTSKQAQYSLDLEYQFTDVDFIEANEELCIYGGSMGAENIMVDIWYNGTWNNVFSDLSPGWNNVSVAQYLDSSVFTVRLRGGSDVSDAFRDSWDLDVNLLHVWGPTYTMEAEFEGSSNIYEWSQVEWMLDSAWTTDAVRVEMQLYDFNGAMYPASGEGYINCTSGVLDVDEYQNQVISLNPENFRNSTGWWRIKVKGQQNTQFDYEADYVCLNTTYYVGYTAQTEFIFTDATDNQSPNLNFTVVTHNSVDGATVTIQVWNYTTSSFAIGGQGYISYTSTGTNIVHWLNITSNAQTCLNVPEARIRVTSVYATTDSFQQITNLVRLQQEESLQLHDYALRVTNNGALAYDVRLSRVSSSNVARLINCTIYFRSGEQQIQVIDGAFTQTVGTWATIPAASSLDLLIEASSISQESVSVIDAELTAMEQGTSTYTKLPVQITIH